VNSIGTTFYWATVPHVNAPGWQVQPPTEWATLVGHLVDHDIRESKDGRLWAPVEVNSTESRTNESVRAVTLFVMDFDCGLSPEEAVQVLRDGGFAYVIHSSHSHTLAKPKFRVVVPLSRPIPLADWREAWSYLHEVFGPASDVSCKNPSRIYFLPSAPPSGAFETWSDIAGGDPIDVDQVYRVIQERRDARKRKGQTESFARTGSIPVGKGDHRSVDLLAWLTASKVNARQEDGGEGKIFVDCPWKHEHTDGIQGPKDTYFLQKNDGGKPVFLCSHSHCKGHGWIDAANAIGGVDAFCAKEYLSPKSRQLERAQATAEPASGPTVQDSTDEEVAAAVEALAAPGVEWAILDDRGNPKCGVANAAAFLRHEFGGSPVRCPKCGTASIIKGKAEFGGGWVCFKKRGGCGAKFEDGDTSILAQSESAPPVRFNEFTRLLEINGAPVQDAMIARLLERLELASRQTKWARAHIDNALTLIAAQVPQYHPIREYLDGLEWDGQERIGPLAGGAVALECEAQQIHRAYLACFFVSAVARIMKPGCKVDTALVLQGPQGVRKSSFFRSLVPVDRWFTDDMGGLENKDASMAVGRTWIVEWAELESVRRSNTGSVKAFLTRQTDSFRPPYGRLIEDFPRASVIVGTTNEDQFLQDATGNRRYMVLPVTMIDTDAVVAMRDQLWAEAVHRFRTGEAWWLTTEESAVQREKNADLVSEDPWESLIARWLPKSSTFSTTGHYVSMAEILGGCLEIGKERRTRSHQMRVAKILGNLGWKRERRTVAGVQQWVYVSPSNQLQLNPDTLDVF
jgi:predicted P-loop ATPase